MKKLLAMWIAALVLVTAVPALAEEGRSPLKDLKELREVREQQKEQQKEVRESIRETIKSARENTTAELRAIREAQQEQRQQLAEDFKERMSSIKNQTKEQREQLKEQAKTARDQLKADKRENRVSGAKELLSASVAHADSLLQDLAARLQEASAETNETSDALAQVLDKIDSVRENLAQAKEDIAALTINATNEEVKTVVKQARDAIKDARDIIQRGKLQHQAMRFGGLLAKLEQANKKLDTMLDRAVEKGVDTSGFADEKQAITQKIDVAKQQVREAQTAMIGGSAEAVRTALKNAQDLAKEAMILIRELYVALKAALPAPVDAVATGNVTGVSA